MELIDAACSLQILVVLCCCWAADVSIAFSPGDTGFVDGEDHPVYYTQGRDPCPEWCRSRFYLLEASLAMGTG